MAITLILCSSGVLDLYLGIALVMGENIGTTVTSNIAALTANAQARRAALAHFIFNTFGVIWILCIFHPFVNMVSDMVEHLFPGGILRWLLLISFLPFIQHSIFVMC